MQLGIDRTKKQQLRRRARVIWTMAAMASAIGATNLMGASQTWTGVGGDGQWSTGSNWSGGVAPGAITNNNSDVATFNGAVGVLSPIIFENQRNLGSFL